MKRKLVIIPIAILSIVVVALAIPAQQTSSPIVTVGPTPVVTYTPAPPEPPLIPTPEAPVETPPPDPSTPAPTPVIYKWADEMSQAGISEVDYGYVTQMLLNDSGWRTSGEGLWRLAVSYQKMTLVGSLANANRYVVKNYGNWQVANALYVRAGNF